MGRINIVIKYAILLFAIFICAGAVNSPVSAQERETKIFVPPLDGTGYIDDMAYFFKQISYEITAQRRAFGRTRRTSDYVVTGRVMPLDEVEEDLPPGTENHTTILYIELFDNQLNEVISNQFVTYEWPDEDTNEMLSVIIYNMLSVIPDSMEGEYGFYDEWRNKRLYLGANFLWSPRVYSGSRQSVNISAVGAEITADYHFFSFLALKNSAEITPEWVVVSPSPTITDQSQDMIFTFGSFVAFPLRPLDIFMIEPYLGLQYNFSLQNFTKPFPLAWTAGCQIGIKTGIGIIAFDPRFSMDMGESYMAVDTRPYWRYSIHLGIGYKMGFFNRN